MEVYVLNRNFETVSLVDSYTSLIWTDRFYKAGDFELYLPSSRANNERFIPGYYLWDKDSEHLMIIEDLKTTSDVDSGNNLTVTGRSIESILERRIVWNKKDFAENSVLQNSIKTLINENIISPTDAKRKFLDSSGNNAFIFEDSTDAAITTLTFEAQYNRENLYEIITGLCEDKKIGFKITLDADNHFVFKLYVGTDRSYSQNVNPYIVFSPNFENVINSEYNEVTSEYRNVALVVGNGSDSNEITAEAGDLVCSGLDRREICLNPQNTDNTNAEKLKQKGAEELAKDHKIKKTFEGEVETSRIFIYGKDYFMGDILEFEDEYGRHSRTKVVEFIRNQDDSGYKAYPSFEVMDE